MSHTPAPAQSPEPHPRKGRNASDTRAIKAIEAELELRARNATGSPAVSMAPLRRAFLCARPHAAACPRANLVSRSRPRRGDSRR